MPINITNKETEEKGGERNVLQLSQFWTLPIVVSFI
jgi:hypothetical protein